MRIRRIGRPLRKARAQGVLAYGTLGTAHRAGEGFRRYRPGRRPSLRWAHPADSRGADGGNGTRIISLEEQEAWLVDGSVTLGLRAMTWCFVD